jgi:hypothetical protein
MARNEGRDPRQRRNQPPAGSEAEKKSPTERATSPPVAREASARSQPAPDADAPLVTATTTATASLSGSPMTIPPLSFDTAIPLPSGVADGLLRRRTRSVLSVNPPTDVPDAFVAKALAALTRDAGGDDKARAVTDTLAQEGLTEAVARATAKLNAGGIDRTQRLLLSIPAVYASILERGMQAAGSDTVEVAAASRPGRHRRRVDFDDTVGFVDFILRTLDGATGFREQYATKLVDAVIASRGLNVSETIRTTVIRDVSVRELPTTGTRVDELIAGLLTQRRATLSVQAAVDFFADHGGEIEATRFTPRIRQSMVSFLRDLGVVFPDPITDANRAQFDEYFVLAYNHALRSSNGAVSDPIDTVRQKGAVSEWDFTVDTFDSVEEQGVVAQNILAAGALDYVYNLGERLGIFKLADALVLRWASGAFDAEPGKPSADLYRYWKLRSERISGEERAMMYRRILAKGEGKMLSGMVENTGLPALWGALMEKATDFIRRSEENASSERTVSRQPIYQATKQLQYNLTEHATGMAHMQITEMYHHLLEAKQVLEHAIAYFSTGSRKSLWTVIERASREWFDEAPNISAIRSAAIDGNRVFQWIAGFDQSSVTDEQFQVFLESSEAWILATATDSSEPGAGEEAEESDEEDIDDLEKEIDSTGDDWDV